MKPTRKTAAFIVVVAVAVLYRKQIEQVIRKKMMTKKKEGYCPRCGM